VYLLKTKCLRSDNGEEYYGALEEYFQRQGIKLKKTAAKTPQLN